MSAERRIYFLGIGGTLMGSLAQLAREMGYRVSGSDVAIYPPMSDQLGDADIEVFEGFDPAHLDPEPELVVIGNAGLPRGHPGVEHIIENGLRYVSGAEWLGTHVMPGRWVLAVTGTHGKTTTASMLAWILDQAGLTPGYLIGGVPKNFPRSSRLGVDPFFVVEADEYDCSYFDRRSKFVHYHPRTLIINNLEYDHADIFPDLAAIQTQFNHLLRTVPGHGLVIAPSNDDNVNETLQQGCWTPISRVGAPQVKQPMDMDNGERWSAGGGDGTGATFDVCLGDDTLGTVRWPIFGEYNVRNGLAAIAAARHAGVPPEVAIDALSTFEGVKRRLELIAEIGETFVYDDFAHHPTAIRATLQGLRNKVGSEEIVAVIEPRSHTMSLGTLRNELATCCSPADEVYWFRGENIQWDLSELLTSCVIPAHIDFELDKLIESLAQLPEKRRHIVIMSNGSFGGIYQKLPTRLRSR
ncbi:MAG: UDP-N-acetylmuramate:L-alanyl-gamma-D-glutamyl-meso-diaminopimelate ligase [Pseudomonadales bacterium]|nr:UDP-N-acetylmuramate:L-alanyl-gamma-D-glutamyl-meso-diaminopimelate ligase [Pseudomonadales bacterium]NIX09704.1 UDP-N-acetylmuramate:L-alanyl-gamma-D-glutamyl-meso-diaminopimelate ligase [Pseudomonadales bacterium]